MPLPEEVGSAGAVIDRRCLSENPFFRLGKELSVGAEGRQLPGAVHRLVEEDVYTCDILYEAGSLGIGAGPAAGELYRVEKGATHILWRKSDSSASGIAMPIWISLAHR